MAGSVHIRKLVSFAVWCIVGAGVVVLLVAAIGYRNNKTCKGYKIEISGGGAEVKDETPLFIGKKDVLDLLAHGDKWTGKAMSSFDLRHMEDVLEKNVWVKDAQLFFDNNEILRINVVEREPIARVFTGEGSGNLIDSSGMLLPLSTRLAARLPVFTGYPAGPVSTLHGDDSVLSLQVRAMAEWIRKDSFWMAQIEQVDIRPDRTMVMIPTIGNHVIEFGDGNDYAAKLHRLMVFYKEVLSKVGFDKYSKVDVAYDGQVVGTRKGSEGTKRDSIQGLKNIQALIYAAQHMEPDTARMASARPLERDVMNEGALTSYDLIPGSDESVKADAGAGKGAKADSGSVRPASGHAGGAKPQAAGGKPAAGEKPVGKPAAGEKPKAVMPKIKKTTRNK